MLEVLEGIGACAAVLAAFCVLEYMDARRPGKTDEQRPFRAGFARGFRQGAKTFGYLGTGRMWEAWRWNRRRR